MGKAVADGPVGQVLAGPLRIYQDKNKIPYRKQVINKSTRVIFGLVKLVICDWIYKNRPYRHKK